MSHLQYTFSFDTPSYFNTTGLEGECLAAEVSHAKTQQIMVYEIFKKYHPVNFTRDEICEKMPDAVPVSIGRCLTNLLNAGKLEMLKGTKRRGYIHNKTQHAYALKTE